MVDLIIGKENNGLDDIGAISHKIIASDDAEYQAIENLDKDKKYWIGLTKDEIDGLVIFLKQSGKMGVAKDAVVIANDISRTITSRG